MSDETKAHIQIALEEHMLDEGLLNPGELVTDWLLITASLPVERTDDRDAIYTVTTASHMMGHQAIGLAAWFLHARDERDRE